MEEHHVHYHHHHHYDYHYSYFSPPDLPSNAQQNDEPLNQEASCHANDDPRDQENNENQESNKNDETSDKQNPENRVPSPVQQKKPLTWVSSDRMRLAVFDDYFGAFNLDAQSAEAQARWTNTQPNNDDHQEGPPRKKTRVDAHRQQPKSRREAIINSTQPRQSDHLTVINKARIVTTDQAFRVFNWDTSGPEINICWRVPGSRNIWLARLAVSQGGENSEHPPSMSPGMTLSCFQRGPSGGESAWSIIMAKSGANVEERIGRGEGELVFGEPISEEGLVSFGRAVGFEVLCV
ncbi:hypothetical protein DER46DRAFT_695165 [Fusarium sp. MPI-SDFR-AT-0072]|nr:hypothetical protein DER46DRAFT_695165 [Fusarium sp. MPI-SDFR-AT-0072]